MTQQLTLNYGLRYELPTVPYTINGIATELLPLAQNVADQLPLGSGEGLAQVLFELVEEAGADGKKSRLKKQVRHNAYLYVDEGQLVGSVGQRQGSTLLPTLRTIWSGGTIGQTNASTERRRIVPAGSYTYGVTVGLQDAHAGSLLNDADGGTPQRFGWAHATDPTIPDEAPAWPGALRISHVAASQVTVAEIATGALPAPRYMEVAPSIEAEIRAGDLAKARGQVQVNALDGHAGLYRLKVAALLALLAGRNDVTVEDWHLAATVHAASNAVRSGLIATVRERSRAADQATNARYAERAVASA